MSGDILVIKLGALGDLLLADGALRDIREQHPGTRIHLLTRKPFATVMSRCPWVDEVRVDANAPRWNAIAMHRWRNWLQQLAPQRVYDLQNSPRTHFYRRWLGGALPPSNWSSGELLREASSLSVPQRLAAQLRAAGLAPSHGAEPKPEWIVADAGEVLARYVLQSPFVLLLPGSSARNAEKRWPGYAELAERLTARGIRVATAPGPDEMEIARAIGGTMLLDGERWLDLPRLADVARRAACVVGNDSGPTHLAVMLDGECIALFDAASPSLVSTGIGDRPRALALSASPLSALAVDAVEAAVLQRVAGVPDSRDIRLPA